METGEENEAENKDEHFYNMFMIVFVISVISLIVGIVLLCYTQYVFFLMRRMMKH